MAVLSLIGITGMYLRQVKQTGVLGLLGYLVFGTGYLILMSIQIIGVCVQPFLARNSSDYVNDVLIAAVGGTPPGDIGPMQILFKVPGFTFLAGGFLFGVALFRAGVLARWAAALLAGGAVAAIATSVLPQINPRLIAVPIGIAMVGLDTRCGAGGALRPLGPCPARRLMLPAPSDRPLACAPHPVDSVARVGAVSRWLLLCWFPPLRVPSA